MELEKRRAEVKDEINMLYVQALQIANAVAASMNKSVPLEKLESYYPWINGQNTEEDNEDTSSNITEQENGDKQTLSAEMEAYKADFDDYIFRHNRAIQERKAKERGESSGRNDIGEAASDHRGTD